MTTDVNFAADACNPFGVPESEPFYIVEFGYGYAYRVYMTQTGEMLGIMGTQTMLISWGTGLLNGAAAATPGSHDVTRGEAIRNTQNALLDMANLPADEVYAMDARARFVYHDLYCHGQEPVWGVHGVRKERCCGTFFGDMTEAIWTQSLRERCSIRCFAPYPLLIWDVNAVENLE